MNANNTLDFENNSTLYGRAIWLSDLITTPSFRPSYNSGEIILLAYPTYLVANFSVCPITSLDGEDLVREVEISRRKIHRLSEHNEEETFKKWLDIKDSSYVFQIASLSLSSDSILVAKGFKQVEPYFPFMQGICCFRS